GHRPGRGDDRHCARERLRPRDRPAPRTGAGRIPLEPPGRDSEILAPRRGPTALLRGYQVAERGYQVGSAPDEQWASSKPRSIASKAVSKGSAPVEAVLPSSTARTSRGKAARSSSESRRS